MNRKLCLFLGLGFVLSFLGTVFAQTKYVMPYSLNIRNNNSMQNSWVKAVAKKGTPLKVLEDLSYGWVKVQLPNGNVGYTIDKYLSTNQPQKSYYTKTTYNDSNGLNWTKVKVKPFKLNVRNKYLSIPIALAEKDEVLGVVSQDLKNDYWLKVKVIDTNSPYYGRQGYVAKKLVEPVTYGTIVTKKPVKKIQKSEELSSKQTQPPQDNKSAPTDQNKNTQKSKNQQEIDKMFELPEQENDQKQENTTQQNDDNELLGEQSNEELDVELDEEEEGSTDGDSSENQDTSGDSTTDEEAEELFGDLFGDL